MWRLLRRLAFSAFTLLIVSFALFIMTHVVPGSPANIVLGIDATPEQRRDFESALGLDRPVLEQYWTWLVNTLQGDLGESYISGLSLAREISASLPVTIELVTLSFIIAFLIGVPLGMISALKAGSMIDHLARVFGVVGVSTPPFWAALLFIAYFAVGLNWLPPGGYVPLSNGLWPHLAAMLLPACTLGLYYIATLSRLTRATMLNALSQDYIRTARAMGLKRPLVWLYALKNALAPVINASAMTYGFSFGAALVVEQVFALPGLSRALFHAIFNRDYPMVQLTVLIITAIFVVANLIADMANEALNPKTSRNTQ